MMAATTPAQLAMPEGGGRELRRDSARERRVFRQDGGTLLRAVHTGEGFLLIEALVAKPGVLRYVRQDGSVTRELLLPEELLRQDSIGTLGRVPVTLEHPPEDVTPENVQQYGVGDLDGFVDTAQQGGFVKVRMAVRRADALAAVKAGVREVSPGYSCRIDSTPGRHPEYGEYDAIQRDRIYNHVAITRQARGGRELCLRYDSAVEALPENKMIPKLLLLLGALQVRPKRRDAATGAATPAVSDIDAAIIRVGAMQQQLAEALPAAKSAAELKAQVAALRGALAKTMAQLKSAQSVIDNTEMDIEEAGEEDPVDPMTTPAALKDPAMAVVAAPIQQADGFVPPPPAVLRTDSIRRAALRLGEERAKLEGLAKNLRMDSAEVAKMGNARLRKAVVAKAVPQARTDADAGYYRAAIDLLGNGARRTDSLGGAVAKEPNPYEGIEQAFAKRTDAAPANAPASAGTEGTALLETISAGFKARHTSRS